MPLRPTAWPRRPCNRGIVGERGTDMDVTVTRGRSRPANDRERANFVTMAIDTETTLSTAIARLRTQQDLFADAQESRRLRVKIGELTAELALVDAELQAAIAAL